MSEFDYLRTTELVANRALLDRYQKEHEDEILAAQAEAEIRRLAELEAKQNWQAKISAEAAAKKQAIAEAEQARIEAAIAPELEKRYHLWCSENPTQRNPEIVWTQVVKPHIAEVLKAELSEREAQERYHAYRAANPTMAI
jgi:hypothetical protein